MSAAAATAEAVAPKGGGKKKLIIILAAVLLLVLVGGGAAVMLLKKKPHADDEEAEAPAKVEHKAEIKRDPKTPPAYVPLDMFVVNLADRDSERYAQVGITLEMVDAKQADGIKVFMPAIRNNILMVLAHKTSADLLQKEGKVKLAGEVQRAASRALGIEVDEPEEEGAAEEEAPKKKEADKKKKKKKKPAEPQLPILAVHFANFIVQ
ncbi:MAG: flagellar basal body-associated FliL family protein [Rubrivivax sp.]|nr:flagellar basal body-associated FliL family protein [Rubrivivax sp.]